MPAASRLRRLRPFGLIALGVTAATTLSACGAGPREANTSTVDAIVLTRGAVVGGDRDTSTGVRALVAKPSRQLADLQTDFRSSLFGDGGTRVVGYLNGLLPDKGPETEHKPGERAEYYATAYPGDRVAFMVKDKSDTAKDPSGVVGLFPAPFSTRFTPKRRLLPARIQCADVRSTACQATQTDFDKLGLRSATSNLEDTSGIDVVRIYVGTWPQLRPAFARGRLIAATQVEQTAELNGYGVQISPDGKQIREGAEFGKASQGGTFGAGTGLIFAIRDSVGAPAWIVTGSDDAGAARAAAGLDEETLSGRVAAILPPS